MTSLLATSEALPPHVLPTTMDTTPLPRPVTGRVGDGRATGMTRQPTPKFKGFILSNWLSHQEPVAITVPAASAPSSASRWSYHPGSAPCLQGSSRRAGGHHPHRPLPPGGHQTAAPGGLMGNLVLKASTAVNGSSDLPKATLRSRIKQDSVLLHVWRAPMGPVGSWTTAQQHTTGKNSCMGISKHACKPTQVRNLTTVVGAAVGRHASFKELTLALLQYTLTFQWQKSNSASSRWGCLTLHFKNHFAAQSGGVFLILALGS